MNLILTLHYIGVGNGHVPPKGLNLCLDNNTFCGWLKVGK